MNIDVKIVKKGWMGWTLLKVKRKCGIAPYANTIRLRSGK
jgi:hypothetical protein